ncbi:MAG TPA: winged helix-turn-helix domain-containing protein [Stellaceae bacterium]|nr:winged helix-turn-helix domain-containing protein [Stellaceae bacterium]
MSAPGGRPVYESGDWEVDLARRELRARGVPVAIGGRAFEIIEVLVRSAGEVVSKHALMDRVWPGSIVEENTLQVHISAVRKALGVDRGLLKTSSGRGYRLLGRWTIRPEGASAVMMARASARTPAELFLTNLPTLGSALIGRAAALQQLRDLLSAYRTVTLTGPGGIGKTTLALQAARSLVPNFDGDVRLVELVSLDPRLVPSAVAGVLGLKLGGSQISAEAVARAIGGKKLLLVLDNCEHVINAAAELAETITRLCPDTTILATSREVLRIEGEHVYRVPPLDVPPRQEEAPDTLLGRSAVQLFIARTTALDASFLPQGENLAAIATICRRLDGIPLAIEFAAARAAALGLQQVATRLDDRFALLTDGRRTALPRHQTLRATLDWSYELLPEAERRLLRRLAVFPAGFTLEAAAAMLGDADIAVSVVLEGIANLVAKSLVALDASAPAGRWRLLETIRAYAVEKLVESGEAAAAARRHAEFFRDLIAPLIGSPAGIDEIARYDREIDNIRAALDWSFSPAGDPAIGAAITVAAVPLWTRASLMEECRRRIEQALSRLATQPSPDPRREMQLLWALGTALLLTRGAGPESTAAWSRALAIAERLDDAEYRLRGLWGLFVDHMSRGDHRTALRLAESFHRLAAGADPADLLVGERMIGTALHMLGEQAEARRRIESMLGRYIAPAHRSDLIRFQFDQRVAGQSFRARVLWLQGFPDQAMQVAASAVEEARGLDQPVSFFYALALAACPVALLAGDLVAAQGFVEMILDLSVRHATEGWNIWGRCFNGVLLIRRGEIAAGLQLLQTARASLPPAAFHVHYTSFSAEQAQALGHIGETGKALLTIDEALARCERNEERWCIAELLRIKGELLLLEDAEGDSAAAEAHFRRALDEANRQQVPSWELRAARSLARLRMAQDRKEEARQILAPVYDRFTEGFDTADLRAARALLEVLPPLRARFGC